MNLLKTPNLELFGNFGTFITFYWKCENVNNRICVATHLITAIQDMYKYLRFDVIVRQCACHMKQLSTITSVGRYQNLQYMFLQESKFDISFYSVQHENTFGYNFIELLLVWWDIIFVLDFDVDVLPLILSKQDLIRKFKGKFQISKWRPSASYFVLMQLHWTTPALEVYPLCPGFWLWRSRWSY